MAKGAKKGNKPKKEAETEDTVVVPEIDYAEIDRKLGVFADIAVSNVLTLDRATVDYLMTFGADVVIRIAQIVGGKIGEGGSDSRNEVVERIVALVRTVIPENAPQPIQPIIETPQVPFDGGQ